MILESLPVTADILVVVQTSSASAINIHTHTNNSSVNILLISITNIIKHTETHHETAYSKKYMGNKVII